MTDYDFPEHDFILGRLMPADMDATNRTGCLAETRTAWTQYIMKWALRRGDEKNVLWLYGLAGCGKSTLATTIANQLLQQGCLGAFLFFERDVLGRSEPSVVVRTVAYQLASNQKELGNAICAVIKDQPHAIQFTLESQFRQLIARALPDSHRRDRSLCGTLKRLVAHLRGVKAPNPIVIVIDALDECGTRDQRASLLRVLSELTKEVPDLRFVITSRPEPDIRSAFEPQAHVLASELETSSPGAIDDISIYFKIRLREIMLKYHDGAFHSQSPWPDDAKIKKLVDSASGLFIWASTAVQFLDRYHPREQMDKILRPESQDGLGLSLDELYRTALESTGQWENDSFVLDFRSMIGVVLVAAHPLSAEAIDQLVYREQSHNNRPCADVIAHLGCVLQQRPTVRLLHPSFAEFLSTKSRCVREYWCFDRNTLHHPISIRCIDRLSSALKANMCNLLLSPEPADEELREDVKYACMYWVEHICRVTDADSMFLQRVDVFLLRHILHWLEAMSILKMTKNAIVHLERLSSWLSVSFSLVAFPE